AREMADGIRAVTSATWGLSVTGIAGPTGGSEEKPVGTVFIGLAGPSGARVERHRFLPDREQVRTSSAGAALELLRLSVQGAAR
ncbi:MAG TPA: CinA family protein, partial [Myxococcaceae bacterium]|nr:CinA family protein [Myxococcaceae bacterium]